MKDKILNWFRKYWLFILILLIILGWAFYSYFNNGIFYLLAHQDISSIVSFVNSFGLFAVFVFILLIILEVVLVPIPPFVLYVAGGILFGAFLGGILTLFGNILGSVLAFMIARKYGRELVEKKIKLVIREKFDRFSIKYGGFAIFFLRLNPLTTSDIFSYLAGLTEMRLRSLIFGTTFGLIPLIFIQTYLGDYFIRDNPFLFHLFIIVSMIYLALFLYGLWYLFRRRIKRADEDITE